MMINMYIIYAKKNDLRVLVGAPIHYIDFTFNSISLHRVNNYDETTDERKTTNQNYF